MLGGVDWGENTHGGTGALDEGALKIKVACAMGLARRGVKTPVCGGGVTMGLDVMLYNGGGDVGVAPRRGAGPTKGGGDELFLDVICKECIPETRSSTGE